MAKAGRKYKLRNITQEQFEHVTEMFKNGAFIAQICAYLDVTWLTYYKYRKENKDFDELCKKGLVNSEAYWIQFGIDHILVKNFNMKVWDRIMRTQFRENWSDNYDPIPRDSLEGFEGTLAQKAKVLDQALKEHKIGLRQYHVLMDALRLQGNVVEIDEIAAKLEELRKNVEDNNNAIFKEKNDNDKESCC